MTNSADADGLRAGPGQRVAKVVQADVAFLPGEVVLGDKQGKIGFGVGKANEVTSAVAKAVIDAKRSMIVFPRDGSTIPHEIFVKYKGVKILLKPARKGTGIIAGGPVRAFAECGGIGDILSKSLGSHDSQCRPRDGRRPENQVSARRRREAVRAARPVREKAPPAPSGNSRPTAPPNGPPLGRRPRRAACRMSCEASADRSRISPPKGPS